MSKKFLALNILSLKRRLVRFSANLVMGILLFGLCFLILQPLFNKISVSFMAEQDLYDSTISVLPRNFTLDNYRQLAEIMDYWHSLLYTFAFSTGIAALQVVSTLLVGYGFARYEFPLKKFWFAMVILVIVVPQQTYASALMLHFRYFDIFGIFTKLTGAPLNLSLSVLPMVLLAGTCTGLKNGLYVYLFRQYFRNIPKDIEEAAFIDGCGAVRTLFGVMLPDAMPLATSCFLFGFVWQWTDNFFSNLFVQSNNLLAARLASIHNYLTYLDPTKRPSPTYLSAMESTGTLMILIPVLVVYLIAQKRFVESLSSTGIKM